MPTARNWTCPHCGRHTTITGNLVDVALHHFEIGETRHGHVGMLWHATRCPNPECNELALVVNVLPCERQSGSWQPIRDRPTLKATRLLPESAGKLQPDYIPQQLREDYYEACRIRDLSPKAAATLARRCLQGIIRDFWKIKKRRLLDEIAALKDKIDYSLWTAIDAVRKVGNIGAHMEEDVNKIVSIDPEEATKLIDLVEILFDELYVARDQRNRRLAELAALGERKQQERSTKPKTRKTIGAS